MEINVRDIPPTASSGTGAQLIKSIANLLTLISLAWFLTVLLFCTFFTETFQSRLPSICVDKEYSQTFQMVKKQNYHNVFSSVYARDDNWGGLPGTKTTYNP